MTQTNQNKRKTLKNIIAVTGVTTLANGWHKPTIQSVVLPAHATMSAATISCGSATGVDMNNDSDQDLVVLSFVPGGQCLLTPSPSSDEGFNQDAFGGNIIIGLDAGNNPVVNWDTEVIGDTNWSVSPNPGDNNTDSGQIMLTATRLNAPGLEICLTLR